MSSNNNIFRKFFILMWKNLLGKKRHWVGTCLEIIVPTVLFMALVALRTEGGDDLNPKEMNATSYDSVILPVQYCNALLPLLDEDTNRVSNSRLLYFPDDALTQDIMKRLEQSVNSTLIPVCRTVLQGLNIDGVGSFSVMAVASEEEIETITDSNDIGDDPEKPIVYGGVIFNHPASDDVDQVLQYTVRFSPQYTQGYTDFIFSPYTFDGPQDENGKIYDTQTAFQALIDLAYIEVKTGKQLLMKADLSDNPNILEALQLLAADIKNIPLITGLEQMTYPAYLQNNLALVLSFMFPLFLILSFAFIVPPVLKRIVYEKETGVKELMKMMGLPSWLHWLCWFLNSAITSTISIIIIVLLIHVSFKSETGAILAYSDATCTFVFLFLYSAALITQLFVLSTLFNQPNLALGIGVLVHILSYFIPSNLINQTADGYTNIPFGSKLLLALIPNINLTWGVKMMMGLEGKGTGVQWSTLGDRITPSDELTMGTVWIMFLVDIFIYSLVIWYIDNVRPGKYGVAQPLYFPFLPSTYCGGSSNLNVKVAPDAMEAVDTSMFEPEPEAPAGIRVRGLRKEFPKFRGNSVVAVDQVSFSAYEGEITTLLGHNGAGKTTTMSVLTGLFSPTSGQATINGYDIASHMGKVRESLGLCPQHNMLFEDLTVREHLVFFGMLKGLSKSDAEKESKQYIEMLNLVPKRNVSVTNLSGGMKRKVNLGIALIGGSKVVMLDEPTSGMDPEARRGMWDLLLSLKADRTILLTTHFMEEADVLGDRIAIMARGKVQCYGTPFFLKRRFGSGYTLTVSRENTANSNNIKQIIHDSIPGIGLVSENNDSINLSLPSEESPKFPDMFETLENKATTLGIQHLGLSLTTMEDVFLKIGEMTGKEANGHTDVVHVREKGTTNGDVLKSRKHLEKGLSLHWSQLRGLFTKRAVYTYRRPILYIVMMLVPVGMAIFNVLSLNTASNAVSRIPPSLALSLGSYTDPITLHAADTEATLALSQLFAGSCNYGQQKEVPDVNQYIIDNIVDNNDLAEYKDSYVIAGDFQFKQDFSIGEFPVLPDWNGTFATGIHNSVPLHAKPLAQMILSNSVLKYLTQDETAQHSISVTTHPLKETNKGRFENIASGGGTFVTFGFGIVVPIGLSILVSAFLIFPLNERATSAKQVQIMAGLNPGLFWLANLVWDNLVYLVSGLLMFGCILALDDNQTFNDNGAPGALLLVIILLGLFGIPFSYAVSFSFNTAAAGFAFLIIVNILAGSIAPTAVFLLRQFGDSGDSDDLILASDIVRWIFTWIPIFPFARSLMAIATVQEDNKLCTSKIDRETLLLFCKNAAARPEFISQAQEYASCCYEELAGANYTLCDKTFQNPFTGSNFSVPCHTISSFYTWDSLKGINLDIIMLVVDGILLFSLLVLLESKLLSKWSSMLSSAMYTATPLGGLLDDDVLSEQERVGRRTDNDLLTVLNLQKSFKKFPAVGGLSFGVKPGECFGLLGINGAGKTTSFRMLTGDETPTKGIAMMLGYSLDKSRSKFLKNIGYCPQFDSIIPELTGRELLTLMCRVRGVPSNDLKDEVDRWTEFLGIQEYIDRESGAYSGGNKRKLNVAMSLVGEPPVVFLDEPSTGVDPVARRNLWNIIQGIQANGQAVVLTSHSMEECEALCDRLGIMVNGQFQCFGTVPHLKNKFAQGFTLLVKLKDSVEDMNRSEEEVMEQIEKSFPKTTIKDRHRGYLQFSIEEPSIPLHVLFRTMESIKGPGLIIEEYSINETTLEQVFLSFAKKQMSNTT